MKYRALGHAGQIELFLLLTHGCLRVDFGGVVLGQGEHIFNKALHALSLDLNALNPLALAFDGALGMFERDGGIGQNHGKRGFQLVRGIGDELALMTRHVCSTGRSAQREKNSDITKNAASAAIAAPTRVSASDFQPAAELASANARYVVSPIVRFSKKSPKSEKEPVPSSAG